MSQQQQNLPTVLQQKGSSEADDKPFSIRYHYQHALKLMLL